MLKYFYKDMNIYIPKSFRHCSESEQFDKALLETERFLDTLVKRLKPLKIKAINTQISTDIKKESKWLSSGEKIITTITICEYNNRHNTEYKHHIYIMISPGDNYGFGLTYKVEYGEKISLFVKEYIKHIIKEIDNILESKFDKGDLCLT